jgi:hypothetical protein
MEGVGFEISITDLNRPNAGKDEDERGGKLDFCEGRTDECNLKAKNQGDHSDIKNTK